MDVKKRCSRCKNYIKGNDIYQDKNFNFCLNKEKEIIPDIRYIEFDVIVGNLCDLEGIFEGEEN